jgi:ParB-like chromosome segregation protein Spo0J
MIQLTKISTVKSNPSNPRIIKDDKFKKLVQSLKDFPEMAQVRPIVCNEEMVVLGGNMRLKAMIEAGWKEVPVEIVNWSEDQQKEFIVKDNVGFGEWDWEMLANEWDAEDLDKWGLDVPIFESMVNDIEFDEDSKGEVLKVHIICENQSEQDEIYNKMIADGYNCHI